MSNQIDGAYQIFYSIPGPIYIGTKTSIEALTGVQGGAFAVGYTATPADGVLGFYDGSAWVWGSGGGGGVESVTGDLVDNTDPANPVVNLIVPTTTTLGGVKRNTGSAGQYVTGIDSSGNLEYDTPAGGGVESVTGDGVNNADPLNPVISYPTPGDIGAEPALGYTPEDVANKKTTMTGNESSNVFYLTAKAIYDWATGLFANKDGWTPLSGTFTRIASALDGTFTVTIASPAVVTKNGHGLVNGQKIRLTTTGALPTGLAINTDYYVVYLTVNTFGLATTLANALQTTATRINTSGTQSGTHSIVVQTDPNYRIQAAGVDLTTTLYEGMPFKLTQNSIVRYGYVCSQPVYSGGNTTFYVLTRCDSTSADYDILDTGTYAISNFNYGLPKQPGIGMLILPSYWTLTVTDSNNNTQATPGTTNCTPGGIGIQKPIGAFTVKFVATIWLDIATTQCSITMGLTEDKTTFTEPLLTFYQVTYATTVAAALGQAQTPISGDTKVFALGGLTGTAGATNLRLRGDLGSGGYTRQIVLTATSDYL